MAFRFRPRRKAPLWIVCSILAGLAVFSFATAEVLTIQVARKNLYYSPKSTELLVHTPEEVFEVANSWVFWTFDRRDHYATLEKGEEYRVVVAGWSIPLFGDYRQIVEVLE